MVAAFHRGFDKGRGPGRSRGTGMAARAEDRSVDQIIFNLRQTLPPDEDGSTLIQSVRGLGHWLRASESVVLPQVQAMQVG